MYNVMDDVKIVDEYLEAHGIEWCEWSKFRIEDFTDIWIFADTLCSYLLDTYQEYQKDMASLLILDILAICRDITDKNFNDTYHYMGIYKDEINDVGQISYYIKKNEKIEEKYSDIFKWDIHRNTGKDVGGLNLEFVIYYASERD